MSRPLFGPVDTQSAALPPAIVEQAAHWLVTLAQPADDATLAAWQYWRQAHPDHERAWQRFAGLHQDLGITCQKHISPTIVSQTLHQTVESQDRRKLLKWTATASGALLLGWAGRHRTPVPGWLADYRTSSGEQRELAFDDGTRIILNTRTAIDIDTDGLQRVLTLYHGEIAITSGAEPHALTTLVATRDGRVRPIGTRFVVRYPLPDNLHTLVTVTDGMVRITPHQASDSSVDLPAGRQTLFSRSQVAQSEPAASTSTAWMQGMLVADRMRLDTFLAELGRYRTGVLDCAPELAGRLVTGTFMLADTDQALQALALGLQLHLRYRTRYWVTLEAA